MIRVNPDQFAELRRVLTPGQMLIAVPAALKRTANTMGTRLKRVAAKALGVKQSVVAGKRKRIFRVLPSRATLFQAVLRIEGKQLRVGRFPQANTRAVGQKISPPVAYIAGEYGVRQLGARSFYAIVRGTMAVPSERVGKSRYPTRAPLSEFTVPGVLETHPATAAVIAQAADLLQKNIASQISRFIDSPQGARANGTANIPVAATL